MSSMEYSQLPDGVLHGQAYDCSTSTDFGLRVLFCTSACFPVLLPVMQMAGEWQSDKRVPGNGGVIRNHNGKVVMDGN